MDAYTDRYIHPSTRFVAYTWPIATYIPAACTFNVHSICIVQYTSPVALCGVPTF
uniref:Uncharacterized protein n=1 Tax=Setaria viridis TaxID=4556 RepID=A0A4V6DCC4_SETVI|nr:hypothetical protein SEVIR_3G062866v2 [Setaria viridis]